MMLTSSPLLPVYIQDFFFNFFTFSLEKATSSSSEFWDEYYQNSMKWMKISNSLFVGLQQLRLNTFLPKAT